ncbi:hypothetical protein JCM8097_008909 [Rhodosporidiobolus ruineniae]
MPAAAKVMPGHSWFRGNYWILPALAAFFWTCLLLGLLLWWAVANDASSYGQVDAATILVSRCSSLVFHLPPADVSFSRSQYVSNIGAEHQWLFIVGTCLTSFFYALALLSERWLRHLRRLPGALRRRDRNADIVCLVFGLLGGVALIILACFNDLAFPNVHWSFTAIFVVCIAISAIAQTLELHWLRQDHVDRPHLKRNAIIKWLIVGCAIAGAIAFAATYGVCAGQGNDTTPLTSRCDTIKSVAAVLEWVIAFLFDAYLISLIFDLWPARKTIGHRFEPRLIEEDRNNTLHAHKNRDLPGAPGGITGLGNGVNGSPTGSRVLDDVEAGTARPSVASEGQYGQYANPVVEGEVAVPEMAATGQHGPVSRSVY